MRISDWSSDVCSSDLAVLRRDAIAIADVLARGDAVALRWTPLDPGALAARGGAGTGRTRGGALGLPARTGTHRSPPGGRAGTAAVGAAWRALVAGLQPAQRAAAERPYPLADAIVAAGGVRTGVAADPASHGIRSAEKT